MRVVSMDEASNLFRACFFATATHPSATATRPFHGDETRKKVQKFKSSCGIGPPGHDIHTDRVTIKLKNV